MKELFNRYVQEIETYIMFQIKQKTLELTPELIKKNRAPIGLDIGAPTDNPPKFVVDKLKEALDIDGIHKYSTPKGEAFFLEAIAQRMKNRFGVDVDPKTEICSLIGSKEGLANIVRELINPAVEDKDKEIILVPDPGYASYSQMLLVSGGLAYPIPLTMENNFMPDMEDVLASLRKDGYDEKKVKAVIINYPNNPLGATAPKEYYKKVVDFCKKHNYLLISDAAYCDMYFDESKKPISALEVEGAKDVTLEFHSFSKPYAMTGWRLGWVCGNKEALGMFAKQKSTIDTGLFKALQYAAAAVLNSDEGEAYIEQANKGFKEKQQILVEGFKKLGWSEKDFMVPDATFYLWLPIPNQYKTSKEFTDALLATSGIVAVPGSAFGKFGEGYVRISIVAPKDKLYEVIERMEKDGFTYTA
ncbi:aminotransferase class I/II-fold pyridoxal phosphate-dependent enzyme [bacterium]|nr:aminotransferase class I/II-fold pyridoxal phosphate-dependent enzyme [bacterium]